MDHTPIIVTGPPGCGKSYWIQKYAQEIQKQLFVCPCRKDRTLRDGRQKLHIWARRTEPAILWLEGADDLTPEAQAFLRRILETHASEVLFILECRDAGRLQEPIRSRCKMKRIRLPSWTDLDHYLSTIDGLNRDEIKEYLTTNELSYRRAKQCAQLQLHYPETWHQTLEHRRKEREEMKNLSSECLPYYIQEGYHPELFIHSLLSDDRVLKDYGICTELAGSLWAFLGSTLDRRAFDRVTTTPPEGRRMNRDSVLSVYSDARTEYTKQLCVFLVPAYFQFYVELLEKAKQAMIHEPKRALWQFQNYLNEIHDWNMEKVVNEIHVIQANSGCDYLEDLLTAVFIAHTKVLTAIRLSSNNKKVEINIPKVEHFLFKVLCETAKLLWSSTYLFRDGIPGMEKQQNYRNIENMLHEGIIQAVRSLVPVKSILKDFVNHDPTTTSKEGEDSDDEAERKEELTVPPPINMPTQDISSTSVLPEVSKPVPDPLPEPLPEPVSIPEPISVPEPVSSSTESQEPSTPVIVLDNKPTVRFGEFNAMFDSDHPSDSDLIMESKENEDASMNSDHESGPVLQILEEEGISMQHDAEIEELDEFNAPSEAIGIDDYEEL